MGVQVKYTKLPIITQLNLSYKYLNQQLLKRISLSMFVCIELFLPYFLNNTKLQAVIFLKI